MKLFKSKKILISLIFAFLLLLAVYFSISSYIAWNLICPDREIFTKVDSLKLPKPKDIEFKSSDNLTLKGSYFESKESTTTIIQAHGYAKQRYQQLTDSTYMINQFLDNGYNYFNFDFRASGISEGKFVTVGADETKDLYSAIKFIKANTNTKKIILLGFSMGASTSVICGNDENVDIVISDSAFSDLKTYLSDNLPVWSGLPSFFTPGILFSCERFTNIKISEVSPVKAISKYKKPVFLIHSKGDTSIPYSNSQQLYDEYKKFGGTEIEFWKPEKSKHVKSYIDQPELYMQKVFEFLNKYKNN